MQSATQSVFGVCCRRPRRQSTEVQNPANTWWNLALKISQGILVAGGAVIGVVLLSNFVGNPVSEGSQAETSTDLIPSDLDSLDKATSLLESNTFPL